MTHTAWPELPLSAWKDTYATLHLWTQIVGKIRLAQTPWLNHSWHVVLYVTSRGLTTSPIPYRDRTFELEFDFLDHKLRASASDGGQKEIGLFPRSVADFYAEIMRSLTALGLEVRINELPNEIPDAIRFSEDHVHASYDREYAKRHWRVLLQVNRVLHAFRTSFIGKCSPVHFFWGSFDLAVTRFSGAPSAPDARWRRHTKSSRGGDARRRVRTKTVAPASGREGAASTTPPSIPMPRRLRLASRQRR